ncbi:MAG: diguanylate cyclase [Vibrio sp.]
MNTNEFRQILDIHPSPCAVHIDFKPVYANEAFANFSGFKSAEKAMKLDSLMTLIAPEEREDARLRYQQAIKNEKSTPKVIAHTDIDGNPVMVEITDRVVKWKGKNAVCTFFNIVTDTLRKERHLKQLSEQDSLTQLNNRRYIINTLNELHISNQAEDYFIAILDIDFFKQINDKYGHLAGDKTLQQFATILQGFIHEEDHLSRLGGEEFAFLIKSNSYQTVYERLEELREAVKSHCFMISLSQSENFCIHCSVSVGATQINANEAPDISFHRADNGLYQAKHSGRNQVIMVDNLLNSH